MFLYLLDQLRLTNTEKVANLLYGRRVPKYAFMLGHKMGRISGPFKDERMYKALMKRVKEKDQEVAEKNKKLRVELALKLLQKIKDDIEKIFI